MISAILHLWFNQSEFGWLCCFSAMFLCHLVLSVGIHRIYGCSLLLRHINCGMLVWVSTFGALDVLSGRIRENNLNLHFGLQELACWVGMCSCYCHAIYILSCSATSSLLYFEMLLYIAMLDLYNFDHIIEWFRYWCNFPRQRPASSHYRNPDNFRRQKTLKIIKNHWK
jgi:hypothetical protein